MKIAIPGGLLRTALQNLRRASDHRVAVIRCGIKESPRGFELLPRISELEIVEQWRVQDAPTLLIALKHQERSKSINDLRRMLADTQHPSVGLIFTEGSVEIEAFCMRDGKEEKVECIKLIEAGMPLLTLRDGEPYLPPIPERVRERWSRTIGVLGERNWWRLANSPIAIVGAGRNGSIVAEQAVRAGLRSITLIDMDVLEEHNIGESAVIGPNDAKRSKATALSARLMRLNPDAIVIPITGSVTSAEAVARLREAEVIFCAVDHDGARAFSATVATLYHKLFIDVGTGVFEREDDGTLMGGDIRVIFPGEGCLACLGGITRPHQVLEMADGELHARQGDFRVERLGSLHTLNQEVVGLAWRQLESIFAGDLGAPRWLRLIDREGVPQVELIETARIEDCPLCRHAGEGDFALERVREIAIESFTDEEVSSIHARGVTVKAVNTALIRRTRSRCLKKASDNGHLMGEGEEIDDDFQFQFAPAPQPRRTSEADKAIPTVLENLLLAVLLIIHGVVMWVRTHPKMALIVGLVFLLIFLLLR